MPNAFFALTIDYYFVIQLKGKNSFCVRVNFGDGWGSLYLRLWMSGQGTGTSVGRTVAMELGCENVGRDGRDRGKFVWEGGRRRKMTGMHDGKEQRDGIERLVKERKEREC